MCKFLKVSRSLVYYYLNKEKLDISNEEAEIENHIIDIFHKSRNNYGTRKIKRKLDNRGYRVSRRRISRIMNENGLVSNYTVASYRVHATSCNESPVTNIVDREFDNRDKLEIAVSDLTYVRVVNKW